MSEYAGVDALMQATGGGPNGAPAEEPGLTATEQDVIQQLEQIAAGEPDNAKSAELSAIIAKLYKLLADEEDAQMKGLGGDPKALRAQARAQ